MLASKGMTLVHVNAQDMIENTFKWARDNGKIIKHHISGGEFVDIDVEHLLKKTNETGSRFNQNAGTHYQAWKPFKLQQTP